VRGIPRPEILPLKVAISGRRNRHATQRGDRPRGPKPMVEIGGGSRCCGPRHVELTRARAGSASSSVASGYKGRVDPGGLLRLDHPRTDGSDDRRRSKTGRQRRMTRRPAVAPPAPELGEAGAFCLTVRRTDSAGPRRRDGHS